MNLKCLTIATIVTLLAAGCGDNSKPAPAPTTPGATGTTDTMKADAEKLLKDATAYVQENKFDLADKAVAELDALKPKLPPEYGPRIDQLKSALASAKAAASKMPGGMKLPG